MATFTSFLGHWK